MFESFYCQETDHSAAIPASTQGDKGLNRGGCPAAGDGGAQSARLGFVPVGAVVRTRPDLRVQAARRGPLLVHRTAAGFGVQELAVTTGPARQAENAVLVVEMVDQTRFGQAFGNLLGVFVLGLKRVHQLQPHQVGQLHLDRHGAAIGGAGVAQTDLVAGPSVTTVNIHDSNR